MKAIQFGAGNIGRGFIGGVLAQNGYEVVFADVVEELLDRINTRKAYTIHVTDTNRCDIAISGVSAVNSSSEQAAEQVAQASIITTAVGLRILRFVAPTIAKGLELRRAQGNDEPLNVIACENGLKATSQLKEMVYALLTPETAGWAASHVGFPDATVDRIVPPVRCEIPLDVAVEEYFEWDVEKSSFVGEVPAIEGMTPVDNLEAYVERKLFTLNTGHATAAYVGKLRGLETIGEAIADPEVYAIVKGAMQQSGEALVRKFGFDHDAHFAYIEKILKRFQNPYLKDECNRVGREPERKLAANDRIILPILTARGFGLPYDNLLYTAAGALHFDNPEDPSSVEIQASIKESGLKATICKYTGLEATDSLVDEIAEVYNRL